ncbi:MAG: hypothetical protein NXH75_05640 [Halobacteriovoraceae bacterium]|nr:hypothetical protein [Halobacteriovoraceae bacterium]
MNGKNVSLIAIALVFCFWAGTNFNGPEKAQKAERGVANTPQVTEKMVHKNFKEFTDRFHGIKDTEELHTFVLDLDKRYDSFSPEVKLMSLHLNVLPLFRGFTYAVHDVVDKNTTLRSQTMTFMREISKLITVNKTIPQSEIMFDYIATPAVDSGKVTHQFRNEEELQNYTCSKVYTKLNDNYKKLKEIRSSFSKPLVFDNQLIQGKDTFKDDIGRFNLIDKPELAYMQFAMESALYQLSFSCIYSIKGAQKVVKKLGRAFGADALKAFTRPDGVSTEQKVAIINSQKSFLTKKPNGNEWAKASWQYLQLSTQTLEELSGLLLTHKDNEYSVYRREYIAPYESHINENLAKAKRLYSENPVALRSSVSGQVITVDVKKFFDNPEQDFKVFFPNEFVKGSKTIKREMAGKEIKYENYRVGTPTGWNDEVLKKYISTDGPYSGELFLEALRVSKSTWDGLAFANILAFTLL